MSDVIKTTAMKNGPVRVPVMMEKTLANQLASYLLTQGTTRYDTNLEKIIRLGIEATRDRHKKP